MYEGHGGEGGPERVPGSKQQRTPAGIGLIVLVGAAGATLSILFPPAWLPAEAVLALSVVRYAIYWGLFRLERWAYHAYLVLGTVVVAANGYALATGNGGAISVVFHVALVGYVYLKRDVFRHGPVRVR